MASFIQLQRYASLADAVQQLRDKQGKQDSLRKFYVHHTLATGGAGATIEVEEAAGETLADRAKTEYHVTVKASAALAANSIVTYTYKDQDGVEHVASNATGTLAAEVEFTVRDGAVVASITDVYATVSCTISTVPDGVITVSVAEAGFAGLTFATIAAGAAAAVQAAMYGVGDLWGWSDTDDAAYDSKTLHLSYVTPWGEVKWAVITYNGTSTTAMRFYESTEAAPTTAGTTTVKDFYRRRDGPVSSVVVQGGDDVELGNAGKSEINAAILAAKYSSLHSRYIVPDGKQAVLGKIYAMYGDATAGAYCTLTVTFTPKGETQAQVSAFIVLHTQIFEWEPACELAELSEVKLQAADDAGAGGNLIVDMTLVEADA